MGNLSLRRSAVMRHWQKKSPRIARVIGLMESMEDWMLDEHEQVSRGLDRLAPRLDKSAPDKLLDNMDPMLLMMAYLSSGRTLMMMDWMDEKYNGRVSLRFLDHARQTQDKIASKLLLERLQTLNSLSLLPQVFSPSRIRFILNILQDIQEEENKQN